MKENPAAHFGAFLSLNTSIQTRDPTQLISFDWINTNQCIVYFQKCADLDMEHVFGVMDELIKITGIVNRLIQDSTTSQEPVYQTRIERAKTGIQDLIVKLNESIRKIREDRQRVINIVESQTESRIGELRVIVSGLSRSLEVLLGESVDLSEDLPEPPPPQLQTKKKIVNKKKPVGTAPILMINDET
jgi:low affinity Fe/Cu permease